MVVWSVVVAASVAMSSVNRGEDEGTRRRRRMQRAFESKREFFVQFLKCFGIFYLLQ